MVEGHSSAQGSIVTVGAASTLSSSEIRLIRGMKHVYPKLSMQAVLSYFTKPERDINHRVIAEIYNNSIRPDLAPASVEDVADFMAMMKSVRLPNASEYIDDTQSDPGDKLSIRLELLLNFWPAGQGLFSTGAILSDQAAPVNWVFDCGTSSAKSILEASIKQYNKQQDRIGANSIDLAALSHFDQDHISGFEILATQKTIEIALLPYVPLLIRILIALEIGVDVTQPIFEFFINPAEYLLSLEGGGVKKVVFVQSSGPEDVPSGDPEGPDGGRFESGADSLIVELAPTPPEARNDPVVLGSNRAKVTFLNRSGRIIAPSFWEFLPYNDAEMVPRLNPSFLNAVAPLVEALCNDPQQRKKNIDTLKSIYDLTFGSDSRRRNVISLFMYSGPTGKNSRLVGVQASTPIDFCIGTNRFGQMYTGDGYLDEKRYQAFDNFYKSSNRLHRSAVFQVMHHGASSNWHEGIAAKVKPSAAIFCSDPRNQQYKHPHAEVLRDFWPYGCVQVDKKKGFSMTATFALS